MSLAYSNVQYSVLDTAVQCHFSGELTRAESLYRQTLRTNPGNAKATQFLGVLLFQSGSKVEGIELMERAIGLAPNDSEAWSNLGNAYFVEGRSEEAVSCLKRALALDTGNASAYCTLSACLRKEGTLGDAIDAARSALRIQPNLVQAHCNLGNSLLGAGDVSGAIAAFEQALYVAPAHLESRQSHIFALHYSDKHSSADIYTSASRLFQMSPSVTADVPDRTLKTIAFLSGDFRRHPVAYFLDPLLRSLDRTRFKVILLSNSPKRDEWTEKLCSYGDEFLQITELSAEELQTLCREHEIDIVVDLAGHTASNRLDGLSLRLAPVQVSWLGYSGTTGLPTMDWILVDPSLVGEGEERHYTERVAVLPDSVFCFDADRVTEGVTPPPCVQKGYVTFGSFNNLAKLNAATVSAWAEILHQVEDSRLIIKTVHLGEQRLADRMRQQFALRGIDPSRIVLLGHSSDDTHFEQYGQIDVALDPFPYSGATTTIEALQMGVPVVSLAGDRYASRMSKSLLTQIGHEEWVASTIQQYKQIAIALASDSSHLSRVRESLRAEISTSPLCQSDRFARSFEDTLESVWANSQTN